MNRKLTTGLKYFLVIVICLGIGAFKLYKSFTTEAYEELPGRVYYTTVDVGSFSPGVVLGVSVKDGDFVKRGDLLIELDNPVLKERLKGMSPKNEGFSQADYNELAKKIENLKLYSPIDGYIINLKSSKEGSYVKESDTFATIVPKDSFKYSALITDDFKKFEKGTEVKIRFSDTKVMSTAVVENVLPVVVNDRIDETKSRMIFAPKESLENVAQLDQDIEILFPKDTLVKKILSFFSKGKTS